MSRYAFIQGRTEPWLVQMLCRLLAVRTAGYYQWRERSAATAAPWHRAAQQAFARHARRYGTRRLRAELRAEGHAVGRSALRAAPARAAGPAHPPATAPHDRRRPGRRGG